MHLGSPAMAMSLDVVLEELKENLILPKDILSFRRDEITNEYVYKVRSGLVGDCSMLSCGCCISENLFKEMCTLVSMTEVRCPICHSSHISLVGPVKQLRNLYDLLKSIDLRRHQELYHEKASSIYTVRSLTDDSATTHKASFVPENTSLTPTKLFMDIPTQYEPSKSEYTNRSPSKQHSLLSLFHAVATKLNNENLESGSNASVAEQQKDSVKHPSIDDVEFSSAEEMNVLDNASNTKTVPVSQDSVTGSIKNDLQNLTVSVSSNEEKEYYFAKCFPIYRRRTQFNTHQKFLRTKSKLFINMAISPDCTKFALVTEHRWEVYNIPNDVSKQNPSLMFCGKSTGEYGPNFENLKFPKDKHVLSSKNEQVQNDSWEHYCCKLSNDFLVIAGAKRKLRIFNLNQGGQPICTHLSNFPIRCIDIDPNSNLIACGITGKDRHTGSEQALIVFHKISRNKVTSEPEFPSPFTITLPYRDPINTIQFSNDGSYLSCSTALESRFLVISLRKINEPRLVMKSLRSIDTSMESEGITDTKLFPGNPNLMCVTSMAFNSPPIVINTKIQNMEGLQTVAQPTMLMRLDELGWKIHKCEVSPRNDSIAFLERNGSVYIVSAPTMMDNEKRRIVLVEMVANAYRAKESAALRFSSDGHKLFILDRKGILYVEDFSYGPPQGHEVTKCKQIN
ncbi:PTR3 (YFR029W) [Zygosaccharomyces parabailii]|nr:PTR3 (YFR029W) [Zygosaccharomyces parabailii]